MAERAVRLSVEILARTYLLASFLIRRGWTRGISLRPAIAVELPRVTSAGIKFPSLPAENRAESARLINFLLAGALRGSAVGLFFGSLIGHGEWRSALIKLSVAPFCRALTMKTRWRLHLNWRGFRRFERSAFSRAGSHRRVSLERTSNLFRELFSLESSSPSCSL